MGAVMIDGERRMTRQEALEEARWLMEGGVSPLLIPSTLGFTWTALDMAGRRLGYEDVSRAMQRAFAGTTTRKRALTPEEAERRLANRRRQAHDRHQRTHELAA